MVKFLDRASLRSRQQQPKDNTRIPLVLTYHRALHKVYEILRQSKNILCVDEGPKTVFRDKISYLSGRQKFFRIIWYGQSFSRQRRSWWKRGHLGVMAQGAVKSVL